MIKEKMVTRTLESTVFTVMTVNTENNSVENVTVTLMSVKSMKEADVLKEVANGLPSNHLFVKIISTETHERLYGMTEAEFIKHATILPDRVKKDK